MANGNQRSNLITDRNPWNRIFGRKTGGETGPWYGGGQNLTSGMFNRGGMFDWGSRHGSGVGQGNLLPQQNPYARPNVGSSYSPYGAEMLGDTPYAAVGGTTEEFAATLPGPSGTWGGGQSTSPTTSPPTSSPTTAPSWMEQNKGKVAGLGALAGGIGGYMQAKSQKKGLGVAIEELDPLKGQFMGEHERQKGLAEAYRPGGKYSQYMAGQMYSQAAESVGQESQRMIASGITSPSMMRAMGRQSRRQTQAAMPGMELQLSQMALPYEKLAAGSMTQYGGVVEQLASLKGARASINPWASAISGASEGMMAAGNMMSSFMPG